MPMKHWSGYKNWQTHAIMVWDIVGQDAGLSASIEALVGDALRVGPEEAVPGRPYFTWAEWLLQNVARTCNDRLLDSAVTGVFAQGEMRWVEDIWRGAFDDIAWDEVGLHAIFGTDAWREASGPWREAINAWRDERGAETIKCACA